jgi:AcrR family transcriptional regulator
MSSSEHFVRFGRENTGEAMLLANPGMDRRTLRTRRALHEAMIGLILDRPYDEVSVAEIADAANVGRSTFYAHYTDKDALLRDGFGHLKAMLLKGVSEAAEGKAADPLAFSPLMTIHMAEHVHLYRALMGGSSGRIVRDEIRRVVLDFIRAGLAKGSKLAPEATVQLLVGSYLSLVEWWLDRGAKEPAADIDLAFRAFARGGVGVGR